MSEITIDDCIIPNYRGGGSTATVKIFADISFITSDAVIINKQHARGPVWYKSLACTVSLNQLVIPLFTIDSTTDSDHPTATYTAVVYNSRGQFQDYLFKHQAVPTSLGSTISLADLLAYNNADIPNRAGLTYNQDQTATLIAAMQLTPVTPRATDAILGKVKLSDAATDPNNPIAVSESNADWQAIVTHGVPYADDAEVVLLKADGYVKRTDTPWDGLIKTEYLENYGNSIATAISTLGSTPCRLVVSQNTTVSADATLPVTMRLVRRGAAQITIAAAKTLTVNCMEDPGNLVSAFFVLANSSTSHIVFGPQIPRMNVSWIAGGAGTGANITSAIREICTSLATNAGGTLYIPSGTGWTTTVGPTFCPNMTLLGDGQEVTILTNTAAVASATLGENIHWTRVQGITLSGGSKSNNGTGFLCTGASGSSGILSFVDAKLTAFQYGFRINATDVGHGWQMAGVCFDSQSNVVGNSVQFKCNSANSDITHKGYTSPAAGDKIAEFSNVGPTKWYGEFAGAGTYGHNQVETQVIVGTAGGTFTASSVVTAAGMTGSPITVSVDLVVGDNTASLVAAKFRAALANDPNVASFFHIGGTGATVQLIAISPAANDGTMNFSIVAGGSSVTPSATSTHTTAGTASSLAHGFEISGEHGPMLFTKSQEEQFDYFYKQTVADARSVLSFDGALVQSPVLLNETAVVVTKNCRLADKVFRGGSTISYYKSLGGDTFAEQENFAGTGLITLTGVQPTNFLSDGAMLSWDDLSTYQTVSKWGWQFVRNAIVDFLLGSKPIVEIIATSTAGYRKLLRLGAGLGRVASAYYDIGWEGSGTTTEPLGYLCVTGSQGGTLTGMSLNGPYVGHGALGYSPTVGIGYMAGSGNNNAGSPQDTDKSTTVAFNGMCGAITMNAAALNDVTTVTFTFTNTSIAANDVVIVNHKSAGTAGAYLVFAHSMGAGSCKISVRNISGGSLSEAIVLSFAVIKGSTT